MKIKLGMTTLCLLASFSTQSFADISNTPETPSIHHNQSFIARHWPRIFDRWFGTMPDAACLEPVCAISHSSIILDKSNQNEGRALPNPCKPCWYRYFDISGGINLDIGKWGNRNGNLMGVNYKHLLSLNDVYINVSARANNWVNGLISVSFSNPTISANPAVFNSFSAAEYDAATSNNINDFSPLRLPEKRFSNVQIEQAYVTLGDLDLHPIFLQFGKQFQDFSRYEIHPITLTLTQVLSEILATSVKLAVISEGFSGSVYVFNDPIRNFRTSTNYPTNYGFSIGYFQPPTCNAFGFSIGASYLHNLIGANNVAYGVQSFTAGGFHNHVSALALYFDYIVENISLNLRYTTAISRFIVTDLPKNGIEDLLFFGVPLRSATGAKPWAGTAQLNYGFCICDKPQNIYLGYQTSSEAAGLNLAKNRYVAGYGIELWHWTSFRVEWDRDFAYRRANGGSNRTYNLVTLRASAKFN